MASNTVNLEIDVRKEVCKNISFHIQYKGMFWFRLGLWLLKLGCWVGGFNLVDEIPISLLDSDGKEITRE